MLIFEIVCTGKVAIAAYEFRNKSRLRFLKVNDTSPGRDRDSLRAIAGAELLHDVLHMRLHGLCLPKTSICLRGWGIILL
jgi:hypothetical protein